MAAFYTDENVPPEQSDAVRVLGHDVLTAQADSRANQSIDDAEILAHRTLPDHTGIVTYTNDPDRAALALRIHAAVSEYTDLAGVLIRMIKPNRPLQAP